MLPESADHFQAVPLTEPSLGLAKQVQGLRSSGGEERFGSGNAVDYRALFESTPGLYLVVEPENFRIVAASDAYLRATMTERQQILGKSIFEIIPPRPGDPEAENLQRLRASLERVRAERCTDVLPVQYHPIPRPESKGGGYEERWWSPLHSPVFSPEGKLIYIIHRVEDVTLFVQRKREQGQEFEAFRQLENRAQHVEAEIELRAEEIERANELRESEKRFREAFAHAPVGMVMVDLQGHYLYVNSAYCQITGYSEDELLSGVVGFYEITHPDDRFLNAKEYGRLLAGEIPAFFLEKRYVRKDGSTVWVRASATVHRNDRGEPFRIIGLVENIDARKRAEEALREREQRYQTLFVSIDQGYTLCEILLDESGRPTDYRFLEVNPAFEKMTGLSAKGSVGHTARELIPGLEEFWAETYGKVALTCEPARFENYSAAMGRWFDVFASGVGNGKFVLLFSDITERKRTEATLHYQHQLIRSITENAPVAIYRVDSENRILFANPASQRLFGWSDEELLGRSLHDTLHHHHPDGRPYPLEECEFLRAMESESGRGQSEVTFFHKDGSVIDVLCSYAPLPEADSQAGGGAIVVVQDITERKRAERSLQEANQRKDEFLAMLAHELRNPLAAIRNAVNVSQMSMDAEDRRWAEEVMERQVGSLSRIVDDLLDMSRISSGKIQLRKERLNAAAVLDHAVETVEALIRKRQHELVTMYDHSGSLLLDADPTRLEQIVVNLLTNAAKYTEPGGRIWLEAKREGNRVTIQVRDTGIGIPPDKLPAMFEIFVQGERTIARSEGGLGIGLSIVRRLVEMHGGTITAYSEGQGKGSTFTVHLPVAKATPAKEEKAPRRPGSAPLRSRRILVVDDNEDTARGLSRILKISGHVVEVCYDGPSALEKACAFHPEFVLLDIGLPGMDGYEVAFRLRREGCCSDSVLIAISGYGQEEDQRRSRQAGFDHHLVKPVNLETLKALLNRQPEDNR